VDAKMKNDAVQLIEAYEKKSSTAGDKELNTETI
jgi:hypothetical protein